MSFMASFGCLVMALPAILIGAVAANAGTFVYRTSCPRTQLTNGHGNKSLYDRCNLPTFRNNLNSMVNHLRYSFIPAGTLFSRASGNTHNCACAGSPGSCVFDIGSFPRDSVQPRQQQHSQRRIAILLFSSNWFIERPLMSTLYINCNQLES